MVSCLPCTTLAMLALMPSNEDAKRVLAPSDMARGSALTREDTDTARPG